MPKDGKELVKYPILAASKINLVTDPEKAEKIREMIHNRKKF